jgi:hypothetical protein
MGIIGSWYLLVIVGFERLESKSQIILVKLIETEEVLEDCHLIPCTATTRAVV